VKANTIAITEVENRDRVTFQIQGVDHRCLPKGRPLERWWAVRASLVRRHGMSAKPRGSGKCKSAEGGPLETGGYCAPARYSVRQPKIARRLKAPSPDAVYSGTIMWARA
jgi:hypothetical protein